MFPRQGNKKDEATRAGVVNPKWKPLTPPSLTGSNLWQPLITSLPIIKRPQTRFLKIASTESGIQTKRKERTLFYYWNGKLKWYVPFCNPWRQGDWNNGSDCLHFRGLSGTEKWIHDLPTKLFWAESEVLSTATARRCRNTTGDVYY